MAQTIDTARLVSALDRIATDSKTLALVERAAAGVAKTPVSGPLAGVKTYIVAVLGALSTLLVVGDAFLQHGGLTLTGWLAAIVALVTSTGFATMRAAIAGHYGALGGMLLDTGQSIALEVDQSQAPAAAGTVVAATVAAVPSAAAGAAAEVINDLARGCGRRAREHPGRCRHRASRRTAPRHLSRTNKRPARVARADRPRFSLQCTASTRAEPERFAMNWESLIGPAAMIGLAMLGGYGWLRDLRAKSEAFAAETGRRFGESEADRKDLRTKLDFLELDSVRRGEMKELKTEIIERVKEAEHTIRGGQAVAIGEMRDMVKGCLSGRWEAGLKPRHL